MNITGLALRARGGDTDWVALNSLAVKDTRIDLTRRVVTAGSVQLDDGKLVAARDAAGAINLLTLLATPAGAAPEAPIRLPRPRPPRRQPRLPGP